MILYRGIAPEQRNDFFGQATITTMVYRTAPRHINSTYVAQSIPMFRNASTRIRTYWIGSGRHKVDLHFQLITTNRFNQRLQGWYSYSLPLFHEHLTMYIHYTHLSYHEQSSQILTFVLLPFALLGLLLCLSLLLALRTGNAYRSDRNQTRPVSFIDTLIWMVGVLAQQGSIIRPNSSSSMVIILVALYMSAIIYCSYLTKIASLLSVDASVDLDLQTMLSAGQYQIGFVGNSTADETVIQKRYDPVMNEIMRRMVQNSSLYSLSHEHALHRVLTTKYALIGNVGSVRKAMQTLDEQQNCNITEIELTGIEQMIALQMPSFYAYRKIIHYEILRYYSNGVRHRLGLGTIPTRRMCVPNKQFYRITLCNITVHLYLLKVGFTLAAILVCIELLYYHVKKFKQNKARKFKEQSMKVFVANTTY
ncbi:uncharacterized protein LOC121587724 isoform X2 [Anopheles merus]|nr:uncharacterized protein LOC121587724 isoform X2 [Anopheles merus]